MNRCRLFSLVLLALASLTLLMMTGCKASKSAAPQKHREPAYIGGLSFNPSSLKGEDERIVREALTWLGTPYRFGGDDYSGTDCSGLTMKVYLKALGLTIPRNSAAQQKFCKSINKGSLATGDLVFFATGSDKTRVSHVGLYLGNGQFIHASASRGVIISNVDERYYTSNYHSSGHVARSSDKHRKAQPDAVADTKSATTPKQVKEINLKDLPAHFQNQQSTQKQPETQPLQFELDDAIDARIDSIYSSFIE